MGINIKRGGFTLISVVYVLLLGAGVTAAAVVLNSIRVLAESGEGITAALGTAVLVITVSGGLLVVLAAALLLFIGYRVDNKYHWYEELLDSIPFPISVTDNDMNWTFVNRPVEKMLNIRRNDVLGKRCENWNADICKTANCGIFRLRQGQLQTHFKQMGMDFQVDTAFLTDRKGRKIGHIEVVQDISAIKNINKDINSLFAEIVEAASQVASSSQQISDGSQTIAKGATEQASAIEQLTVSLENISNQAKTNAETAKRANELSVTAKNNAISGNEQMKNLQVAIENISDSSASISKIIKTIDDIAFQTNILALNAAVEAARAGEHGKGFAVVAQEVKSLAEKSASAAKTTTDLIEGTISKVATGMKITGVTAEALEKIVSEVEQAVDLVGRIYQDSTGQAQSIEQINIGIDQLSQIVTNNSATAEESAAATEELSGQAELLRTRISSFKVDR